MSRLTPGRGSSWTASGSRALPEYSVSFPLSQTVDGLGNPIVAWRGLRASGGSSDCDLVVEQWSAGAWVRLGGVLNVQPGWGVSDAQVRASGATITVAWGETFYAAVAPSFSGTTKGTVLTWTT